MKKPKHFLTWIAGALLMLMSISSWAQNPTYTAILASRTQPSCNTFEFDVMLKRTGTVVFQLAQFQMGITMNPALVAGGTITVSPVANSSTLSNPAQIPGPEKFSYDPIKNCIIVTAVSPPGTGNGSIILSTGAGTKYIRIRVMNSVPWPAEATNVAWNFNSSTGYVTKMFAYTPSNTDITTPAMHTVATTMLNATPLITGMAPPAVQVVTGDGGTYCAGNTGAPVGLAASENGVAYRLYKNGVATSNIIYGRTAGVPTPGSDITFGNQTQGFYQVAAYVCGSGLFPTSATILPPITPATASVFITTDQPGGNVVPANTLVTFTANPDPYSAAQPGTTYQWFVNGTPTDVTITMAYIPLDGDVVNIEMYADPAACVTPAIATATMTMQVIATSPPTAFNITGAGSYCAGAGGRQVGLDGSQFGVSYQLKKDGVDIGAPVPGTGSALTPAAWAGMTAGTFTVFGTANGLVITISGTTQMLPLAGIVITENPLLPVSVSIIASANPVCAGTSVTFTATPVNGGTPTYQWYRNNLPVGTGLVNYSYIPVNGDVVKVIMTSSLTGCVTGSPATSNTVTMTVNPFLPVSVSIVASDNPICPGTSVTFTATPANGGTPSYQWYKNGVSVGLNQNTYTDVALADGDQVHVIMTSSLVCVSGSPATSNTVTMSVVSAVTAGVSIVASANPVCPSTSVTFTATPVNGGTPTYQWYLNGAPVGAGLATYSYIPANGNQVYVVMTSSLGCATGSPATSNTITMIVNPMLPVSVTIVADANPVNAGIPVTFTATPTNGGTTPVYQWYVNNVIQLGQTLSTFTYTPTNGDIVKCILTSSEICASGNPATSNEITMVVISSIIPSLTGPITVCEGSSAIYTTDAGMTGYSWSLPLGGGSFIPGPAPNQITVTWNTAGARSVNVTYDGATPGGTTLNVTVNPLLPVSVSIAASANPVCFGTAVTFTATPTNGGTTPFYQWKVNGVNAGPNNPVYTYTPINGDVVTCVLTSNATCPTGNPATSNPITMTVNPLLPVSVTISASANPVCAGTAVTFTATPTNGGTTPFYQWKVNGVNAGSNSPVYTYTPANGNVVTCVLTSNATCPTGNPATSNPITMIVNPLLPVSITIVASANPVCAGIAVTFTATPTNGGTTPFYQWKVNGVNVGTNNPVYTFTPVNGNVITCVLTSNATCPTGNPATSNAITMTVNPLPVPTITGPASVCVGSCGNLYTTQTGMTGYIWTVSPGNVITTGQGTSTITVCWLVAGPQTVAVSYTNANGCTAAAPTVFNVTATPLPVPTITGYTSMCVNIGPLDYVTESGMTGYIWTVSPGNTISGGQGTNQVQINWTVSGTQWVAVTYTSPSGCSPAAPTQLNVFVNPLPGPAGTITGTAAVCGGTNGVAYSVGVIANTSTYVWTLPAGASIATGAGTNSITVDFGPFASSGNITVYGNNVCGNGASSPPFAVTVTALPDTAGVITGQSAVCQGVSGVIYTVPTIANATGYVWTVPAGATIVAGINTNSITVNFSLTAVSGMITVYGTNSCGNGAVGPAFAVTVNPIPPTPVVTFNGIILHSSAPTGNLWYFEGAPAPPPNTGQDYTPTEPGFYWCVVTLNGCSSDTSNHVWVPPDGIQTEPPSSKFVVYPVPNDGRFNVSITYPFQETFNIKVYNNLGVMISEIRNVEVNGTTERTIDLRPTPTGVYSVVMENSNKHVIRKILINR